MRFSLDHELGWHGGTAKVLDDVRCLWYITCIQIDELYKGVSHK